MNEILSRSFENSRNRGWEGDFGNLVLNSLTNTPRVEPARVGFNDKAKADIYEGILGDYLEASRDNPEMAHLASRTLEVLNREAERTAKATEKVVGRNLREAFGANEAWIDSAEATNGVAEKAEYADCRMDVLRDEQQLLAYKIPAKLMHRYPFMQELPRTVAVTGETARSIARELLTGEQEPVRDISLMNVTDGGGNSYVDNETLMTLAEEFVTNKAEGIQSGNLKNYFESRDFTTDQALVLDGQVVISDAARNDLQENIIRPSYNTKSRESQWIGSQIASEALLRKSMTEDFSENVVVIEDIEPSDFAEIQDADIARVMDIAVSKNIQTSYKLSRNLVEYGVISSAYENKPMAVAQMTKEFLRENAEDMENTEDMNTVNAVNTSVASAAETPRAESVTQWVEDDGSAELEAAMLEGFRLGKF